MVIGSPIILYFCQNALVYNLNFSLYLFGKYVYLLAIEIVPIRFCATYNFLFFFLLQKTCLFKRSFTFMQRILSRLGL